MGTQIIGKFSLICRYNRVATVFDVADSPLLRAQSPEPEPDARSYIDLTAALLDCADSPLLGVEVWSVALCSPQSAGASDL
jgi:hypothetical protein